jgi:NhaA family Na+:H+ antiporter
MAEDEQPQTFPERLGQYVFGARRSFNEFLHLETSGAVVLLIATVAALVLANSAWGDAYEELWHVELGFKLGDVVETQSLLHWIDDGLMALFFFVVGLEIKREFIVGELAQPRKAALPIAAAIGGMAVPALIYLAINLGTETQGGWGIPMATDIAFVLGVVALLGSRIPASAKVFITALAIVDDIGAVLVIAVFYTAEITWAWLALVVVLLLILVFFSRAGVMAPLPYALVGLVVWFAFFQSGVHATIAGVLVAFTIPARARISPMQFVDWAKDKLEEIVEADVPGAHVLESDDQQLMAAEIREEALHMQAPLQRIEHALHPFTTFVVLPLFALANAGVRFVGEPVLEYLTEPVSLGIIAGLVLGKQIGVTGFSWLAVKLKIAELPPGVHWTHVYGLGVLAGIGFTMALFISGLAFRAEILVTEAKLAILVASLIAGVWGYAYLRYATRERDAGVAEVAETAVDSAT